MAYPNLLVVGAQKAGSTWLHGRLKRHPDVFMSEAKELHHFVRPRWRETLDEYAAHFADHGGRRIRGESSPGYLWHADPASPHYRPGARRNPDIAGAARETLGPDARIVLSLRHPVDRAVSAYLHHFRRGRFDAGCGILEVGDRFGIVDMGFYARHVPPWIEAFGRDNVHVVLFDDLAARPRQVWTGLCAFLEIPPVEPQDLRKRVNAGYELVYTDGRLRIDPDGARRQNHAMRDRLASEPSAEAPSIGIDALKRLHALYREDIAWVERRFDAGRLGWSDRVSSLVPEAEARV